MLKFLLFIVTQAKVKGRIQRPAKGFIPSKNAYMLVYSLAIENRSHHSNIIGIVTPMLPNLQIIPKVNGIERHGVCSTALEGEMILWKLEKRLVDRVNEQNRKFEEWTTEENDKRVRF